MKHVNFFQSRAYVSLRDICSAVFVQKKFLTSFVRPQWIHIFSTTKSTNVAMCYVVKYRIVPLSTLPLFAVLLSWLSLEVTERFDVVDELEFIFW